MNRCSQTDGENTIRDCKKYQGCNAPICPLDHDWVKRSMRSEDAVCFYLSEYVKGGAEARFRGRGLGWLYDRITEVNSEIAAKHRRIHRGQERAKVSGSRIDRFMCSQMQVVTT